MRSFKKGAPLPCRMHPSTQYETQPGSVFISLSGVLYYCCIVWYYNSLDCLGVTGGGHLRPGCLGDAQPELSVFFDKFIITYVRF